MTATSSDAASMATGVALSLRCLAYQLSQTLEAFAVSRMRKAVPESEQRRARREIARYRRLMRGSAATPTGDATAQAPASRTAPSRAR